MSANDNQPPKPPQPPKAKAAVEPPLPAACPICGKPRQADTAPFCSKRCADIDLHRWLKGTYVIPGPEPEESSEGDDRD